MSAYYEERITALEADKEMMAGIFQAMAKNQPQTIIAPNATLALNGGTVHQDNRSQVINNHFNQLRDAIENEPEESFTSISKDVALDTVKDLGKDLSKAGLKAAAEKLKELGTQIGASAAVHGVIQSILGAL